MITKKDLSFYGYENLLELFQHLDELSAFNDWKLLVGWMSVKQFNQYLYYLITEKDYLGVLAALELMHNKGVCQIREQKRIAEYIKGFKNKKISK